MASIQRRDDGRWRARFRDDTGKEHAKHFAKKADAQRWSDAQTASLMRGDYVDPRAGRVTFKTFAEAWLAAQTFDESSRVTIESRLRAHLVPKFGEMELRAIRPSHIQAWLRAGQANLAPRSLQTMRSNLYSIFAAAVDDGLLARNPVASRSVKAPKSKAKQIEPWTREQLGAVIDALPAKSRAVAVVGAGCGLRQGEVFGLRVSDIDFLHKTVHVRQQVKPLRGKVVFVPPKGGKERMVPLPDAVAFELAEHLRRHPPRGELVFTSATGLPIENSYFNSSVWKPALVAAGVEPSRVNGMHALRHFYASTLLDAGESIRALAEHLGHRDPGFTLRVYAHMMPNSADRTRHAIDAMFENLADSARTTGTETR